MSQAPTDVAVDEAGWVPPGALGRLRFDNRFTAQLPADPREDTRPRPVLGAAFSRVRPAVVPRPRIVAWSRDMSEQLGLDDDVWQAPETAEVFTGSRLLPGSDPHAMRYGGHQFGNWAGQLGDGRAIALGEVVDRDGRHQTLQLKGAGPTPYSRRADGLAVLRSSIREFLCSEAMHHLGVPTTRALCLAETGTEVIRDMFYDGHPAPEPGAVVCRVAPSFIRFGNFEILAAHGEIDLLRALAEFTIRHHAPHHLPAPGADIGADVVARWFDEICRSTADLMVAWQRVGFVHGVMNTDNMSVHGLTIDYGPYGWLDDYDPGWTPNTTDAATRRYRFGQQARVAQWNLLQLANALYPLVEKPEPLEASLHAYAERFEAGRRSMLLAKLGLVEDRGSADDELLAGLETVLTAAETDMTIFFLRLGEVAAADLEALAEDPSRVTDASGMGEAYYRPDAIGGEARAAIGSWLARYGARVAAEGRSDAERGRAMARVNPRYVLRNYLAQEAIDAAEQGDHGLVTTLAELLRQPYVAQPGMEGFALRRPDWARQRPGCSMLSCSS